MGKKDSFFAFIDGLAGWAKMELQRRGVQTLSEAMSIAESLIELKKGADSAKPKDKKVKHGKGGGEKEIVQRLSTEAKLLEEQAVRRKQKGPSEEARMLLM